MREVFHAVENSAYPFVAEVVAFELADVIGGGDVVEADLGVYVFHSHRISPQGVRVGVDLVG